MKYIGYKMKYEAARVTIISSIVVAVFLIIVIGGYY